MVVYVHGVDEVAVRVRLARPQKQKTTLDELFFVFYSSPGQFPAGPYPAFRAASSESK